jgi:hypothetical protein
MKCAKGGITLGDAMGMEITELEDWIGAASELEERIAKAMKG